MFLYKLVVAVNRYDSYIKRIMSHASRRSVYSRDILIERLIQTG